METRTRLERRNVRLHNHADSTTVSASPVTSRLARNATRIGVGFILLGLLALATTAFLYRDEIVGSMCRDGWVSESVGAGRCSNHDGVDRNLFVDTPLGVSPNSWMNVSRWALGAFGLIDLGIGAALIRVGRRRSASAARSTRRATAATGTSPATRPDLGVIELKVKISESPTGRTLAVSVDGGPTTTVPFFFRDDEGRASRRLADLMANSSKRRIGRRGRSVVETYGAELFEALFPEPARSRYREARAVALQTDARLRLLLDMDDRTSDLPWEYLFDEDRSSFLAMSHDTSVIRIDDDGHETRSAEPVEQLRLLTMAASPRGLAALHGDKETERIRRQLAPFESSVQVRQVQGDTLDDLRRELIDFEPHIFHFVGHGHWDDELDDGAVAFADEHGARQPVSGRDLGVVLNRSDLRLVLFNSCDAARTSKQDRFAGVAGSLVAQGVPAAIGMQYPIEDQSAAAFGSEFLAALVATHSIDDALTEARTAIYTSRSVIEWGTPVLTTRVPVDHIIRWASPAPRGR